MSKKAKPNDDILTEDVDEQGENYRTHKIRDAWWWLQDKLGVGFNAEVMNEVYARQGRDPTSPPPAEEDEAE